MRTTNNMLISNMIGYISNNQSRMERYQYQMATGKKIKVPSDDPVVAARALKLRTDVSEIAQYKKNVGDAQSWMEITETALSSIGDILHRAGELAVQAANETNSLEETQKIRSEISQLKEQVVDLANTSYNGRYIFSGFKTDQKLLDVNGNYAIDVKNTENIKYQTGIGDDINVNVVGSDLLNNGNDTLTVGGTPAIIDYFNKYLTALDPNQPVPTPATPPAATTVPDEVGISNAITNMQTALNNVLRIQSDVGSLYQPNGTDYE